MSEQKKPKPVTYQELVDILDRKKATKNKYRLKISYCSTNPEDDYTFNLRQAMLDSKI